MKNFVLFISSILFISSTLVACKSTQTVVDSDVTKRKISSVSRTNQNRHIFDNGIWTVNSWDGMSLTTADFRGRETLMITNKDVFKTFLEFLGVCGNTIWRGLHTGLLAGNFSCDSAVENLKLGFNIFLDYRPKNGSYADAHTYIWHKDTRWLDEIEPWILQNGRFANLNEGKEFEIVYNLFPSEPTNLKMRVKDSANNLEDCKTARFTMSLDEIEFATGKMFSSDSKCP